MCCTVRWLPHSRNHNIILLLSIIRKIQIILELFVNSIWPRFMKGEFLLVALSIFLKPNYYIFTTIMRFRRKSGFGSYCCILFRRNSPFTITILRYSILYYIIFLDFKNPIMSHMRIFSNNLLFVLTDTINRCVWRLIVLNAISSPRHIDRSAIEYRLVKRLPTFYTCWHSEYFKVAPLKVLWFAFYDVYATMNIINNFFHYLYVNVLRQCKFIHKSTNTVFVLYLFLINKNAVVMINHINIIFTFSTIVNFNKLMIFCFFVNNIISIHNN